MRRLALLAAVAVAATATPALAANPPGPLHGFCAFGAQCIDNSTNTPTAVEPPVFGFANSGANTSGDLTLVILLPDNLTPTSFTVSGGNPSVGSTSFTLVGDWTSGFLDAFLGISSSPANGIGAYLPTTLTFQPTAGGFNVYSVDIGTQNILGTGGLPDPGQDNYLFTLGQNLAAGSYIVGFLQQGDVIGGTANSGAILETGGVPEPATWAMMLVGFGAAGVAMRRSRRKQLVSQLA